jgi:hypothetical protein
LQDVAHELSNEGGKVGRASGRPIVYLDQRHLSELVRHPQKGANPEMRRRLVGGEARLAVSMSHVWESARDFDSRGALCRFVDECQPMWGRDREAIYSDEVRSATFVALGLPRAPVEAFVKDFRQRVPHLPRRFQGDQEWTFTDAVASVKSNGALRNRIGGIPGRIAEDTDRFKQEAAIVKDEKGVALAMITPYVPRESGTGLLFGAPPSPEAVYSSAGGIDGFPGLGLTLRLQQGRSKDGGFVSAANDVIDEQHAVFAPYATATALDRRTAGRVRALRISAGWRFRVTDSVAGVLRILDR